MLNKKIVDNTKIHRKRKQTRESDNALLIYKWRLGKLYNKVIKFFKIIF